MMRTILIIGFAVGDIGLAGISGASAVPANGTVIGDLASEGVTAVRWGHRDRDDHRRWDHGRHDRDHGRHERR
jgi:hypothetical protein